MKTMLFLLLAPVMAQVDYDSQIQPIFNSKCTQCHGNSAGLNLSSFENMMMGSNNGDIVIPYDHISSVLWQRVNSGQMPPGNNDLTDTQVDLVAQWIDEGALPEVSTSSCVEGYIYIEDLPDNLVNNNNEDQCFYNDDLAVIDDLISLNNLNYSNVLEVGVQKWNNSRITSWVLTYTQNGSNGVNQQLTALPENIGNLTSLISLYLEWNQLTILPDSFSQLTNLFNLAINNNWLCNLPANFGNINNLFFLDLGYNQLISIPESICDLENLHYLYLFNNQLTSVNECICELDIDWDGFDGAFYPYFASGGNQLCDSDFIPDCIENSSYFEITLDQFYYSFMEDSPQNCQDDYLAGDINGDESVNIQDIIVLINFILNVEDPNTGGQFSAADMNDDGVLNIQDIILILNIILG